MVECFFALNQQGDLYHPWGTQFSDPRHCWFHRPRFLQEDLDVTFTETLSIQHVGWVSHGSSELSGRFSHPNIAVLFKLEIHPHPAGEWLNGCRFFKQTAIENAVLRRCCDIMESGLTTLDISLQPTFSDLNLGIPLVNHHFTIKWLFHGYTAMPHFQTQPHIWNTGEVEAVPRLLWVDLRSWLVQNFHFPGYPVVMGDSNLDSVES